MTYDNFIWGRIPYGFIGLVVKKIRGTECKRDRKNMAILLSVATSKRGVKRKKVN